MPGGRTDPMFETGRARSGCRSGSGRGGAAATRPNRVAPGRRPSGRVCAPGSRAAGARTPRTAVLARCPRRSVGGRRRRRPGRSDRATAGGAARSRVRRSSRLARVVRRRETEPRRAWLGCRSGDCGTPARSPQPAGCRRGSGPGWGCATAKGGRRVARRERAGTRPAGSACMVAPAGDRGGRGRDGCAARSRRWRPRSEVASVTSRPRHGAGDKRGRSRRGARRGSACSRPDCVGTAAGEEAAPGG